MYSCYLWQLSTRCINSDQEPIKFDGLLYSDLSIGKKKAQNTNRYGLNNWVLIEGRREISHGHL